MYCELRDSHNKSKKSSINIIFKIAVVTEYKNRIDKLLTETKKAHDSEKDKCKDVMDSCLAMKQQTAICQVMSFSINYLHNTLRHSLCCGYAIGCCAACYGFDSNTEQIFVRPTDIVLSLAVCACEFLCLWTPPDTRDILRHHFHLPATVSYSQKQKRAQHAIFVYSRQVNNIFKYRINILN